MLHNSFTLDRPKEGLISSRPGTTPYADLVTLARKDYDFRYQGNGWNSGRPGRCSGAHFLGSLEVMATVLPGRAPLAQPFEVGPVADHRFFISLRDRVPRGSGVLIPVTCDALDADLFLAHLAANLLGALNDPLADRHLLLDHRPLLHRDLLLPDRDADLLAGPEVRRAGLTRRGLPLDDYLLPLHRDLHRPVLGDDLLADPGRARLHGLLVGLQLLLAELDPLGALGRPGGMGDGAQVVGPVTAQEGRRLVIAALRRDGHGDAVGFGPADESGLLDRDLILPEPGLSKLTDGGIRLVAVLKGTDDGRTLLVGRSHGSSPDARTSIPSPGAHPAPGLPSPRSGGGAKPMPECSPESRNNGIHWINAIYPRMVSGRSVPSCRVVSRRAVVVESRDPVPSRSGTV